MTKTQLIGEIYKAFEGVTLEDGVGLWEGRALDDRIQDMTEYNRLKTKDEREDWQKIPIVDLYKCNSSLSFFDAKGMRFHLGLLLLFDLEVFLAEEDELHEDKTFKHFPPEVRFALTYQLESDYSRDRFSLLNTPQITCVVHFLEYALQEKEQYMQQYAVTPNARFDKHYKELVHAITHWKVKALIQ